MIGRLHGVLLYKKPPELMLDVNGVGYEISAPMSTFYQLPETGAKLTLHTHLVVREDAHLLFGFATENERELFRILLKVSGVGPKVALAILSGVSVEEFARCVRDGDASRLVRLPGIGKKTAERLLVEMKDRVDAWSSGKDARAPASAAEPISIANSPVHEAVAALVSLGYSPPEASKMITKLETQGRSSEQIIRAALQTTVK
jgi:Holliday junction DNA helicase RuvA